jgi:succinoglycan biosynthesis transport protein ExoP
VLGPGPIESLKKRVLKVDTVRNTRILEIAATLPDAGKAQALAQFLAESTVALNRSMVTESDRDLLQGLEQQERVIRARLEETETAWARLLLTEPLDDLQSAMEKASDLRSAVQEQAQSVELEIADAGERLKQASAAELVEIRKQDSYARARLEQMRRQIQSLDAQNAEREKRLAMRQAHRDKLEAERKAAQVQLTAMDTRLREARGEAGFRGERLRIVDPGIVPERPSSPNIPLNVAAAMLLGLVLPVVFLTLRMSYQERAGPVPDLPYRRR